MIQINGNNNNINYFPIFGVILTLLTICLAFLCLKKKVSITINENDIK
ncbi:MAG: hypothetical protein N4A63_09045 [Vallitalea sp.]|nr:hypothetical protein [Vallitalea sp.]